MAVATVASITQDQVREIVRYAQDRFVTIIPEIEMPGHGMGAIASYPELTCFPNRRKYIVRNIWGIEDDVYCAGKESTFEFIQNVLDEVVPLFPGEYFTSVGTNVLRIAGRNVPTARSASRLKV